MSPRTRPRLSGYRDDESYDGFDRPSPATYAGSSVLGDTANGSPAYNDGRDQHHSSSNLANSMMRTVVSSGNDALNILFEAAAAAHDQEPGQNDQDTRARGLPADGEAANGSPLNGRHATAGPEVVPKIVHPVELSDASRDVLSVWEACRFVKMGWFTSREAVTFID